MKNNNLKVESDGLLVGDQGVLGENDAPKTALQPEYYDIDFIKVKSFNELILVLSNLGAGVALHADQYENSPIKPFLTKTKP